jgi:hypothetical protein
MNVSRAAIFCWALFAAGCTTVEGEDLFANWKIEQLQLDDNHYRVALIKQRFSTGGDGEAMQIFYRRAADITRERGAKEYRVVEYTEGIESSLPIAQRVARGVIELTL